MTGRSTSTRQVWNVRLGPCWCSTRPGVNGSFDLLRWRVHHVGPEATPNNLVIATSFIPRHVGEALEQAMRQNPEPWTVITHRICPQLARRGVLVTQDLVDISAIAPIARHVPVCVADQPEQIALTMLSLAPGTPAQPAPPRLAAL